MIIRNATLSDIDGINLIRNLDTRHNLDEINGEHMNAYTNLEDHELIVAIELGVIVGFITLDAYLHRNTGVLSLFVHPDYRNNAIGTKLLEYLLDKVKKQNKLTAIYLHVSVDNIIAIKLYNANGFHEDKRNLDKVVMSLNLRLN